MTIKLKDVRTLKDTLTNAVNCKTFSGTTKFALMEVIEPFESALKKLEAIQKDLFTKYATEDSTGGLILKEDEKIEAFNKEYDELLEQEVTFEDFSISKQELGASDLTAMDFKTLKQFNCIK